MLTVKTIRKDKDHHIDHWRNSWIYLLCDKFALAFLDNFQEGITCHILQQATQHVSHMVLIEDIPLKDYELCAHASGDPNIERERRYKQKLNHMLKRIKGDQKLNRQ